MKSGDASDAYRKVYPHSLKWKKPESVHEVASRLRNSVKVASRIKELQEEQQAICVITKNDILAELKKVAFSDFAGIYDKLVNQGMRVCDLTPEERAAIKSITARIVGTTTNDEGDKVPVEVMKIELHDKLKAIERICHMLGFDEPTESKVSITDMNRELTMDEARALIRSLEEIN